jgi:hypothetical protein
MVFSPQHWRHLLKAKKQSPKPTNVSILGFLASRTELQIVLYKSPITDLLFYQNKTDWDMKHVDPLTSSYHIYWHSSKNGFPSMTFHLVILKKLKLNHNLLTVLCKNKFYLYHYVALIVAPFFVIYGNLSLSHMQASCSVVCKSERDY